MSVPPELIDRIIDYAASDRSTLSKAGLVQSPWLPRSRFCLFSSVWLTPHRAAEFEAIIHSPFSTLNIHGLVRDLHLDDLDDTWFSEPATVAGDITSLSKDYRESLCRSVISLSVSGTRASPAALANFIGVSRRFPNLTTLELSRHIPLEHLAAIFSALPNLQYLDLRHWNTVEFSSPTNPPVIESRVVRQCRLQGFSCEMIGSWTVVPYRVTMPALQFAQMDLYDSRHMIPAYFAANGPSIQHLVLDCIDFSAQSGLITLDFDVYNLGYLTNLISIRISANTPSDFFLYIATNVISELIVIDPLPLEKITLSWNLAIDVPTDLKPVWGFLDNCSRVTFKNLKVLEFVFEDVASPAFEEQLRAHLPYACEQGILFVHSANKPTPIPPTSDCFKWRVAPQCY